MNMLFAIQVLIAFLVPLQMALAATDDEIIEAFTNDAAVQNAIRRVRLMIGGDKDETQIVPLGGGCGVAGCRFRLLVVRRIINEGSNPQTGTVLATIEGMNGRIEKVELAEVTCAGSASRNDGVDLQLREKIPPPPPDLKIERKYR